MPYTKTTFVNSSAPAINATELNKIGTGIEDAYALAQPAHVFRPEDNGALGDGQVIRDVSVTTGSAVITSAAGKFVSGDVGKEIMISGALGVNNIPLMTTIASHQSATQVTLSASATTTASSLPAVWGTDDTQAIRDCLTAAGTYARAHDFYAEVRFGAHIYMVAAAPIQTTNPYFNTQLPIPVPTDNTDRKLEIALIGAGRASQFQFWAATVPSLLGTCIVSTQTAPVPADSTYGVQSVIGAPTGYAGFTGNFVNVKPVIRDLSVVCPAYTNMVGIDLKWAGGCYIDGVSTHIFALPISGGGTILADLLADSAFQSRIGCGIITPCIGNNADVTIPDFCSEGYTVGARISAEHAYIGNLKTIYNDVAVVVDQTGLTTTGHGLKIARWTPEAYNGGILAQGGGTTYVDIGMSTEFSGGVYDVSDSGNSLRGRIDWFDAVDNRVPVVTGAGSVKVIDQTRAVGLATAPAVPATTVALQNPFWRDAAVTVTGGTVTVIEVSGTATGLTSGTVIVPSGKTITLTYSSAPSWVWILL